MIGFYFKGSKKIIHIARYLATLLQDASIPARHRGNRCAMARFRGRGFLFTY